MAATLCWVIPNPPWISARCLPDGSDRRLSLLPSSPVAGDLFGTPSVVTRSRIRGLRRRSGRSGDELPRIGSIVAAFDLRIWHETQRVCSPSSAWEFDLDRRPRRLSDQFQPGHEVRGVGCPKYGLRNVCGLGVHHRLADGVMGHDRGHRARRRGPSRCRRRGAVRCRPVVDTGS